MNLDLSDDQAELVQAFRRFFDNECPPARVRAAEPVGFDDDLWQKARAQGVVAMAVAEDAGGWGASLLDLCLVAEQHGRALTPAPIIEAQAAARLLARLVGDVAERALANLSSGDRLVTTALRPERGGVLLAVPGAAVADEVLFCRENAVMAVPLSDDNRRPWANIGCLPLADVDTNEARPLDHGPEAGAAYAAAVGDWMVLTASAVVGLAARALEIGCQYARDREQFGIPIAAFQAVAHPLADSAAAIDGARLLCYEAAWRAGERSPDASTGPEMALWYAAHTAAEATRRSLHVHGGYGFMSEYDIQMYFRRARGWVNVIGDPRTLLLAAADRRYGPASGPR